MPLSVVVLCFSLCNGNCYSVSVYLSKGMTSFRLVHGNVNSFPKNEDYPNHSWVERDGYVYDPTDGYKWEREFYYQVYEPEVIAVYDESTVQSYDFYQEVSRNLNQDGVSKDSLALMLQYLEILEMERSTVNHTLLLKEIEVCRREYGICKKYSSQVIKRYRDFMEESLKKS